MKKEEGSEGGRKSARCFFFFTLSRREYQAHGSKKKNHNFFPIFQHIEASAG